MYSKHTGSNFAFLTKYVYFSNSFQQIDILSISCKNGLRLVPQNPISDTSTLVQVMAWETTML